MAAAGWVSKVLELTRNLGDSCSARGAEGVGVGRNVFEGSCSRAALKVLKTHAMNSKETAAVRSLGVSEDEVSVTIVLPQPGRVTNIL